MGIRNLGPLTMLVVAMVIIDAAISPLFLAWGALHMESLQTFVGPIATEINYGSIAFHILTMIIFSVWIHQAGTNLLAAGFEDLEFTPGSRIWWFAVPIASLFKPFQGMRELWNASHGTENYSDSHGIVPLWWALWLASSLANTILSRTGGTDGPSVEISWGLALLDIALAVVAIMLLRGIANAQAANLSSEGLTEVFA